MIEEDLMAVQVRTDKHAVIEEMMPLHGCYKSLQRDFLNLMLLAT